jgi:hypothetical protein
MEHIKPFDEFDSSKKGQINQTVKPWYKREQMQVAVISGVFIIIAACIPIFFSSQSSHNSNKENPKEKDSLEISNKSVVAIQILQIKDIEKVENLLASFRSDKKLRELTALESGKSMLEMPNSTYGYISGTSLQVRFHDETYQTLLEQKTERFKEKYESIYKFEIHKYSNTEIYLCGFVSQETSSNISQLSGRKELEFAFTPMPLNSSDNIAIIPIDRIIQSKERDVDNDNKQRIYLLDLKIK